MKKGQGSPNAGPYEWIRVTDILVPKDCDAIDEKVVSAIAESIRIFGLLHPIAVRGTPNGYVLVAGAHRLEAMKQVGGKKIACILVDGDGTDAQMIRLGENLFRKTITVLRQAEGMVEYIRLASARVSGQLVRKCKPGRPPSGIARAARELPLVGRSEEARRKIIERAIKIDGISPEAKEAAIDVFLDNNQSALLKIANADGSKAQVRAVARLAEALETINAKKGAASKRRSSGPKPCAATNKDGVAEQPNQQATLAEMEALWASTCRARWAYLPVRDRTRFIEMLGRAKCHALPDLVEFVKDLLRGRQMIRTSDMYGFASARGFTKGKVKKVLKGLGCKSRRLNFQPWWSIINPDQDWKEQLPVIADEVIRAAVDSGREAAKVSERGLKIQKGADYLKDV